MKNQYQNFKLNRMCSGQLFCRDLQENRDFAYIAFFNHKFKMSGHDSKLKHLKQLPHNLMFA